MQIPHPKKKNKIAIARVDEHMREFSSYKHFLYKHFLYNHGSTYEPDKDDGGCGMVGVILVVDTEAADRAGLMADAYCRLLFDGSEKKAMNKRAVVGIDRRKNMSKSGTMTKEI